MVLFVSSVSKLRKKSQWLPAILLIASCVAGLTIALSYTGVFQFLEWSALDRWFCLRPAEPKDSRIVVVTISESDLSYLGQWPVSNRVLNQVITQINQQKPRAIGLDLYRDLPLESGQAELEAVFRATPNLIGVEKVIGDAVKPSPVLEDLDQIALADLVIDRDGKIRRSLLSIKLDDGEVKLGLATRLALMYLAAEGIELKPVGQTANRSLGKAVFVPFRSNDGGYLNADAGGFQILLNFRGTDADFERVSIVDVLTGKIPKNLFSDRIVLIGSTAQSLNDLFLTPYSHQQNFQYMPGVFVHANTISHILSAALDGRSSIQVVAEPWEWLWIFVWSCLGSIITVVFLRENSFFKHSLFLFQSVFVCLILPAAILFNSGYLFFLCSWWLPVISPLFALISANLIVNIYYSQNQKQLTFIDGLTLISNRRCFDEFLHQKWWQSQTKKQYLSLILCDIDYFKQYNDTYGHQAGDRCLQQVALGIRKALRSNDFAARYGGEEFVVVLPNTNPNTAIAIAQRIVDGIKSLQILHHGSQANKYVSLSCGVASTISQKILSPEDLIEAADLALYEAKKQGHDRAVLADLT